MKPARLGPDPSPVSDPPTQSEMQDCVADGESLSAARVG
jgi:hypothetical protein